MFRFNNYVIYVNTVIKQELKTAFTVSTVFIANTFQHGNSNFFEMLALKNLPMDIIINNSV